MKRMISRLFSGLIELILWICLVVVVFFIVISLEDRKEEARDLDYIREVAVVSDDVSVSGDNKLGEENNTTTAEEPSGSSISFNEMDRRIDFKELKEINPDIIAWISIPRTNIDYPVLQSGIGKPEDYYLRKTYDGKSRTCGSIYMQKINDSSFRSRLSIIYGHNMKSKTMFADLHKFLDKDFFTENKEVYIYTPTQTIYYEIISVNERGPEHLMAEFSDMEELMQDVKENALFYRKIRTDSERVLSLYTCGRGNNRVAVFCVEKERVDISNQ